MVVDPETNAELVYMMGPFIKKLNGVHINKLLDIRGKGLNNLPMIPEHIEEENGKNLPVIPQGTRFLPRRLQLPPYHRK